MSDKQPPIAQGSQDREELSPDTSALGSNPLILKGSGSSLSATQLAGKMSNAEVEKAEAEETRTAFFYGTLMEPQVFFSVCYSDKNPPERIRVQHTFKPAVLHGYCRHRVRGADYPGMIEDPQHSVFGMVVDGITKANLERLDFFEGSTYDRRVVRPHLLTTVGNEQGEGNVEGEQVITESYIFLDKDDLDFREWDFAEFKRDKLTKWTRAGYVFEDCDPNDKATVSAAV